MISAAPLVVLPSKDTIEELFFKEKGMSAKHNYIVTLLLIILNCVLALFIPNIGDAMTLVGSTINPVIGFIIPVVFYWKVIDDKPLLSFDKVAGVVSVAVVSVVSVLSLINFFGHLKE